MLSGKTCRIVAKLVPISALLIILVLQYLHFSDIFSNGVFLYPAMVYLYSTNLIITIGSALVIYYLIFHPMYVIIDMIKERLCSFNEHIDRSE